MSDSLKLAFNVSFHEAIKAAQKRSVVLPESYYGALQGTLRQHAFSIAGITALDQLEQVRDSLAAGLQRGVSFNKWKKEILENGVLDLPAHRLDNIFRTNIQNNYNRGRWEKLQSTVNARPYLMYDAINDSRVRPAHSAMDGIIRRADDSFWDAHAPSNGFRSLLPSQRVSGNAVLGLKAFYSGKAVEIITSDGSRLSMTAQHPVLTSSGWIPSDKVKQGDELICYGGKVLGSTASGEVDIDNSPPTIKYVFDTLSSHIRASVPRAFVNLYGDIKFIEGDVDIVGVDGSLMAGLKSEIRKLRNQLSLTKPNRGKVVSSRFSPFFSFFSSSNFKGFLRCFGSPLFPLFASIKQLPLKLGINNNVVFSEKFSDSFATYFKPLGDAAYSYAAIVKTDNLARHWSAQLRSLSTPQFISNNFRALLRGSKHPIFFKVFGKSVVTNIAGSRAVRDRRAGLIHDDDMIWNWLSSFRALLPLQSASTNFSGFKFGSFDSSITDDYIGDPITNPDAASSIINRHSKLVKFQDVASVRFFDYHGYVYDLETKSGTILAFGGVSNNHFVLSNCRCRVISLSEKQAQARSAGGKGLNKSISKKNMKPDKGWDYNPAGDFQKGVKQALKNKPPSKIKNVLVKKIKKDDLLDGVILKGSTTKQDFIEALDKLHPDHNLLVSKLKKPISIDSTNTDGPHYNPFTKKIAADTATRDGQTFRHEYGHHIDNVLNGDSYGAKSLELNEAWNKDRKRLGLVSRKTKFAAMKNLFDDLYDIEIKKTKRGYDYKKTVIKDIGLSGVSDVIDSLTRGLFQKEYGGYGHGTRYFSDESNRYAEIFAQFFYLRSTKHWAYTKEKFPALTSKFISLIDEGLKNAT